MSGLEILDLTDRGPIDYLEALALQQQIHHEVATGVRPSQLLLLEHKSVYTAGKRTEAHERPLPPHQVIDVDRGGKITWHGPGQLVGYPIIKLSDPHEVVGYVRVIEIAIIETLKDLGIESTQVSGRSGVWVKEEGGEYLKIAAIGIRVAQGTTMHGFAINLSPDLSAFEAIIPCGIADARTTSIHALLGDVKGLTLGSLAQRISNALSIHLAEIIAPNTELVKGYR